MRAVRNRKVASRAAAYAPATMGATAIEANVAATAVAVSTSQRWPSGASSNHQATPTMAVVRIASNVYCLTCDEYCMCSGATTINAPASSAPARPSRIERAARKTTAGPRIPGTNAMSCARSDVRPTALSQKAVLSEKNGDTSIVRRNSTRL